MTGLILHNQPVLGEAGFSPQELTDMYYQLTADADAGLMFETASIEILDAAYNAGEPITSGMVFDAVTTRYNKFPRTMAALQRVFNRQLTSIEAQEPEIGTPKAAGGFATVTVQFPFSDGQKVSVIFHSPGGDEKKIKGADEVIAFRWLLNKREITHIVAPEMTKGVMKDIPLQTVARRITQLVTKNSEKFQKRQADLTQQKEELARNEELVKSLEYQTVVLTDEVGSLEGKQEQNVSTINHLKATLSDLMADVEDGREKVENARHKAVDADPLTLLDKAGLGKLKEFESIGGQAVADKIDERWEINYEIPDVFDKHIGGNTSQEVATAFVDALSQLLEAKKDYYQRVRCHKALETFVKGGRLPKGWQKNFEATDAEETWAYVDTNIRPADPDFAGSDGDFYQYAVIAEIDSTGDVKFNVAHDEGSPMDTGDGYVSSWKEAIEVMKADAQSRGVGEEPEKDLNDLHWYGLQARPAGLGATPNHVSRVITRDEIDHNLAAQEIVRGFPANYYRHGIIGYEKALTPDEISGYELFDFSVGNGAGLWNEFDRSEKLYELAELMENFDGTFSEFFKEKMKAADKDNPFWDHINNRMAAKQLILALEDYTGRTGSVTGMLRTLWEEFTGKDPEAGRQKMLNDQDKRDVLNEIEHVLQAEGWTVSFDGHLDIEYSKDKGRLYGMATVSDTGDVKLFDLAAGKTDLPDVTFKTPDSAIEHIRALEKVEVPAEEPVKAVVLKVGQDVEIDGRTFKIKEVDHDHESLTYSETTSSAFGRIMSFEDFEEKFNVKIARREQLKDDGSEAYYRARIEQVKENIENYSGLSPIPRDNMQREISELNKKLAQAQGVDAVKITDEMIDRYRESGSHSEGVDFLQELFPERDRNFVYQLADRVEQESRRRAENAYEGRPETKLARRIFSVLKESYPVTRQDDQDRAEWLSVPVGVGRVVINKPVIAGEKFTLKMNYMPDNYNDRQFDGADTQEKSYPLVDGLILDSADSVISQIKNDFELFRQRFQTITDTTNVPAYGSKLEETKGLSAAEISKRIRAEIKEDIAAGKLPKGLKTSVKTSGSSMHSSIDITVKDLPASFPLHDQAWLKKFKEEQPHGSYSGKVFSNETEALKARLKALGNQYNYDDSDPMADYFNTRFYLSVDIDNALRHSREESEGESSAEETSREADLQRFKDKIEFTFAKSEWEHTFTNFGPIAVTLTSSARPDGNKIIAGIQQQAESKQYSGNAYLEVFDAKADEYQSVQRKEFESPTLTGIVEDVYAHCYKLFKVKAKSQGPVIPERIWQEVVRIHNRMIENAQRMNEARQLDKTQGSEGRYEHDAWVNTVQASVTRNMATLDDLTKKADGKGIDLKQVISDRLGPVPNVALSSEGQAWADDQADKRASESSPISEALDLLKRAAAGEFKTFEATMAECEKAMTVLEEAGVEEDHEELIGLAADKALEFDEQENG